MLKELAATSDRVVLTVRIDRSGHREWLDASGHEALVYWEAVGGGRDPTRIRI